MNLLTICPCCTSKMLRHLRDSREYWFCRHCWAEMPNLETKTGLITRKSGQIISLSICSIK